MITGLTLSVENGPQAGLHFHICIPGVCTVGRASDCDLAVIGPEPMGVSRYQCRIDVTANRAVIFDLGSRNGTNLNGKSIGKRFVQPDSHRDWWTCDGYVLADGDVIDIAGLKITVGMQHAALEVTEVEATSQAGVMSC